MVWPWANITTWGTSRQPETGPDPAEHSRLAVPELIFEMRRRGHDDALIRKVVFDNPLSFFDQCPRFRCTLQGAASSRE